MMQYIITEYQNMGRGQIHLCRNETITLRLYKGEANQMSLAQGVELSEEQYRYLLHDIIGKRAAKRAMHLLERQERTEYQLREKLRQNCYPPEAIEDAVDYVKRYHYLDDERYARTFIHFHQETRSKMRLKNDLARRGISRELIAYCLEEEFVSDERAQIKRLLDQKNFSPDTADREEYGKMYRFLMRRGFCGSDISSVMRR